MLRAFVSELGEDLWRADRLGTLNHLPIARRPAIKEGTHDEFWRKLIESISIEIPRANRLRGIRGYQEQKKKEQDLDKEWKSDGNRSEERRVGKECRDKRARAE